MYLGNSLISWSSSQQSVVALSTVEAEYIAMSHALKEILYLRNLLNELKIKQYNPTILYCDNQGAIALAHNPTHHKLTKHIDIRYHRVRNEIENNNIIIKYINTNINPADIMTKPLSPVKHNNAITLLKLCKDKLS